MPSRKTQFRNLSAVIANPKASHPAVVTAGVWITAKEMQGHPLTLERMDRVGAGERHVEVAECETASRIMRIRNKVRDRAILIGQTRPAPLILIDALRGKGA